jgi:predicted DCC family thiol-disulfide oxidoreductase YuxK
MLFAGMPAPSAQPEFLFYDGHCALCHHTVRFVLRHDPSGSAFRFAPLQGPTFRARVPAASRAGLPDSIVVLAANGSLLSRSDAFIHILRRLGGGWKTWAALFQATPRPLRDAGYDLIARIRYRVFGMRDDLCPVVPPEWRARFEP